MEKQNENESPLYKNFPITGVCRSDLISAGLPTDKVARIDDGDMAEIASKMADAYCEQDFWIDLPIIVEHVTGIKEK